MLFSKKELAVDGFEDLCLSWDDASGLSKPKVLCPKSSFDDYPDLKSSYEWQALLDEIDFYKIDNLHLMILFAFAQNTAEANPNIPKAYLYGETAQRTYEGFLNIKIANRKKIYPADFLDNAGNAIALQLRRENYLPTSNMRKNQFLLIEKETKKTVKPTDHFELDAESEAIKITAGLGDDISYREIRIREWQKIKDTYSPKTP